MPTDLNTLDDWWNEGFDDFFDGSAKWEVAVDIAEDAADAWTEGRNFAIAYRNAMKEQGQ